MDYIIFIAFLISTNEALSARLDKAHLLVTILLADNKKSTCSNRLYFDYFELKGISLKSVHSYAREVRTS